ncbi:hypothetical protein J437_LFUL004329 [Ladona fulva]|uniref:Uncharacterized protein n=1 Tax=Ladona fulva TaxID=123851 RepID=A0A8K0K4H5_LADFU|nr:hypothetical protein J437_LFUL004329 [Ladona fulva]
MSPSCFPGADIYSDHELLFAEIEIRLKRIKIAVTSKRWDLVKLKEGNRTEDVGEDEEDYSND